MARASSVRCRLFRKTANERGQSGAGTVSLKPDTVIYEVKAGPYKDSIDKSFAPWAPAEGTVEGQDYLKNLLQICNQHLLRACR